MDYSFFITSVLDEIRNNWQLIQIISNFAIVGTFIATLCTFYKTFNQNKKNEQIKNIIEINKQLVESEDKIESIYQNIIYNAATSPLERDLLKRMNSREIESYIITYFNIWEWLSFLVNTKFLSEKELKFFKERFVDEYKFILKKFFPYLDYPEIKKLYRKWKK